MRFITIATDSYSIHVGRLIRSLKQQHPGCSITVFCETALFESALLLPGVTSVILPDIGVLGVKRAKFTAYAIAAREGGFIYLDADMLILQPLEALLDVKQFTACRDDLRECPFIEDPTRPWVNAPHLSGEKYFNSGVFAVPDGYADFFEIIKNEAVDNEEWLRFTVGGKLYDNHFLCAKVVQYDIPVRFISEYEYNWQGLRTFGRINCYVDDSKQLRNRQTGGLLRVIHFAGIKDIDTYISTLPPEVCQVLAMSLGKTDSGILETLHSVLNMDVSAEGHSATIMAQAVHRPKKVDRTSPGAEEALFDLNTEVASIVHSIQESDFLWNNLKCGGAYLSAAEYQRLRSFVMDQSVCSVLEFGAGYTTALFTKIGCGQIALEGWNGPWFEFAQAQGSDVRLVPFVTDVGFSEDELKACCEQLFSASGKKLVFIDSPPGTANRLRVVKQVVRFMPDADFYVVHDSVRDAAVVYELCSTLGLMVADHLDSFRGLTFLCRPGAYVVKRPIPQCSLNMRVARMRFDVHDVERIYASDGHLQRLFVKVINTGEEIIEARSKELMFSMHLMSMSGQVLKWDTPRYKLPVDLQPGDHISFKVDVGDYIGDDTMFLFDFVKEGEFWWSDISGASCPKLAFCEI